MSVNSVLSKYLFKGGLRFQDRIREELDDQIDAMCRPCGRYAGTEMFKLFSGSVTQNAISVDKMYDITLGRNPNSVSFDVNIVERLCEQRYILGTYHVHPAGGTRFSQADIEAFLAVELRAGHPIVHVIETTAGDIAVWDLSQLFTARFYNLIKEHRTS